MGDGTEVTGKPRKTSGGVTLGAAPSRRYYQSVREKGGPGQTIKFGYHKGKVLEK